MFLRRKTILKRQNFPRHFNFIKSSINIIKNEGHPVGGGDFKIYLWYVLSLKNVALCHVGTE